MFPHCFKASALVLIFSTGTAFADSGYYLIRGIPDEPDALKIMLAASAEPLWVEASEIITISELIDRTCGILSESVKKKFLESAKKLNGFKDDSSTVTPGLDVAIPFCTFVSRDPKVIVNYGDTLSEILQRNTGIYGPKSVRSIVAQMYNSRTTDLTHLQVDSLAKNIKPGDVISLPYASPQRLYIAEYKSKSPEALIASMLPWEYEAGIAEHLVTKTTLDDNPLYPDSSSFNNSQKSSDVTLVEPVSLESIQSSNSCHLDAHVKPFEQAEFDSVFQKQLTIINSKNEKLSRTLIGIIDSGLGGYDGDIFRSEFFAHNEREISQFAKTDVDDDENGFTDDILGINFENDKNRIKPFSWHDSLRKQAHGTQVASLTLGGVDYILGNTYPNFIEMIIVNFGRRGGGLQNASSLLTAIDYLDKRQVKIINMSLSTSLRLHAIDNHFDILFIASAGNNSQNMSVENRYPAFFGGNDNRSNVITVGAHAANNEKARFSNYGKNVDLYAPGCNLKVVDDQSNFSFEYGTSMSAGIVTFVSSAINSLVQGGMSPKQIKERLIRSSDYKMNFQEWDEANLLNPYKSISLYQDVIELRGQNSGFELIYGKIPDIELLRKACSDPIKRTQLNGIVKMTPNLARENKKIVKYLLKRINGGQYSETCVQDSDFKIDFTTDKSNEKVNISIDKIVDVVVSSF